jgi:uncharacterized SAM-binding protein YcdF (DUF218 family)
VLTGVSLVLALQTDPTRARAIVDTMKTLMQPVSFATALIAFSIGGVLLWVKPRWGRWWVTAWLLTYWILTTPVGVSMLAWSLDGGYAPLQRAEDASGARAVVLLGGGNGSVRVAGRGLSLVKRGSALRLLETARVYRLLGDPFVIVSGGLTDRTPGALPESEAYRQAMLELGVPAARIVTESESQNTHEQAMNLKRLLAERRIDRFVMVTSPVHMTRAMETFEAQGLHPIASPAPLYAETDTFDFALLPNDRSLDVGNEAVYEWFARGFYWAEGWTRQ